MISLGRKLVCCSNSPTYGWHSIILSSALCCLRCIYSCLRSSTSFVSSDSILVLCPGFGVHHTKVLGCTTSKLAVDTFVAICHLLNREVSQHMLLAGVAV